VQLRRTHAHPTLMIFMNMAYVSDSSQPLNVAWHTNTVPSAWGEFEGAGSLSRVKCCKAGQALIVQVMHMGCINCASDAYGIDRRF
jgi:hypothetical protein